MGRWSGRDDVGISKFTLGNQRLCNPRFFANLEDVPSVVHQDCGPDNKGQREDR